MKQLIRKILKEENLKQNLKQQIKDYGLLGTSDLVDGIENLFKLLDINSPMDFLHLFDDLKVVHKKKNNKIYYINDLGEVLMYYQVPQTYDGEMNKSVYVDYINIWSILQFHFKMPHSKVADIVRDWAVEVYGLQGFLIKASYVSPKIHED